MKGQQSLSDIEYGMRKHKTKREAFLDSMESLINWDKWCSIIEPTYIQRKARPTSQRYRAYAADVSTPGMVQPVRREHRR